MALCPCTHILYHKYLNFSSVFLQKQKKFLKCPKVFKDPENIMKKDEFLKLLQARLIERGLSESTAEKETTHVRTYLAESSMDDVDISIDEMADGILAMLEENSESNHEDIDISPVPMVSEEADESVSDELSAAIAAIDAEPVQSEPAESAEEKEESTSPAVIAIPIVIEPEAEHVEESDSADEVADEPTEEPESVDVQEEPQESAAEEKADAAEPAQAEAEPICVPAPSVEKEQEKEEISEEIQPQPKTEEPALSDEEDADIEEYIPYKQKVKMKKIENTKKGGNEWLYVLLLVITIPIAVALILTAFVVYLGFWVALALAMIACIAVLVVFVTVFALISIVGIVYGVVELITGNMPVGLFEIGLGVMVGAAVMFIGILVYNFAVRFIPFIMKLLARLFRAGFRGIKNGYQVLKGAVEEL